MLEKDCRNFLRKNKVKMEKEIETKRSQKIKEK